MCVSELPKHMGKEGHSHIGFNNAGGHSMSLGLCNEATSDMGRED